MWLCFRGGKQQVLGETALQRRTFLQLATIKLLLAPVLSHAGYQRLTATKKKRFSTENLDLEIKDLGPYLDDDSRIKDYLHKIRNPNEHHLGDFVLNVADRKLLAGLVAKMKKLCRNVGYGNFGVLGFEEAIYHGKTHSFVGSFTLAELDFLDNMYRRDASEYGFYGEKQLVDLYETVDRNDIVKVPGSGNFLFKGKSLDKYERIKKDLGRDVLLTSGIRGLVKQFYLFINKADRHGGNLSLASRSLAPPGYSYHATGDFDIGQMGFGVYNFSERFTGTPVFQKLAEQGYVDFRYQKDNSQGVRYEPWHIKL